MRKILIVAAISACLSVAFCELISVHAKTEVNSVPEVEPGMNIADVLADLQGTYSIISEDAGDGMRHYGINGGPDQRYYYEIYAVKGKVASIWKSDAKAYSGDTYTVGTELFDALYAAGKARHDPSGEAMGVRNLSVSVELQKPASDSSSRTIIFKLPGEDFRLASLTLSNGTSSLAIQRVRTLDDKAFDQLIAPSPAK